MRRATSSGLLGYIGLLGVLGSLFLMLAAMAIGFRFGFSQYFLNLCFGWGMFSIISFAVLAILDT